MAKKKAKLTLAEVKNDPLWEAFKDWAEGEGISLKSADDWGASWVAFSAGALAEREKDEIEEELDEEEDDEEPEEDLDEDDEDEDEEDEEEEDEE